MQIFLVVTTLIFLFSGVIFSYTNRLLYDRQNEENVQKESEIVKGIEDANVVLVTPSPSSEVIGETGAGEPLLDYQYPDSQIVRHSSTLLLLSSPDDVDIITSWYRDKMEEAGLNTDLSISTKAGEKELSKLAGGDNETRMEIEVSKEGKDSKVVITVGINN